MLAWKYREALRRSTNRCRLFLSLCVYNVKFTLQLNIRFFSAVLLLFRCAEHTQAAYRHVHFPEHLGSSASVQQSDVLRRRHDDGSCTRKHQHITLSSVSFCCFCCWQLVRRCGPPSGTHQLSGCSGWLTAGRLPSQEACQQPGSQETPSPPTNKHKHAILWEENSMFVV